jgi:hypothetical protein
MGVKREKEKEGTISTPFKYTGTGLSSFFSRNGIIYLCCVKTARTILPNVSCRPIVSTPNIEPIRIHPIICYAASPSFVL